MRIILLDYVDFNDLQLYLYNREGDKVMPNKNERFKTLLKQNGLKVTTQRILILEALEDRPDKHLTAEEIYECVKEQNPDIGLATVYRTIQLLSELNLIDKLNLGDGYVRYEIGQLGRENSVQHHHHHLICLSCGNVFTVQDDLLETLEQRINEVMDFEVVDHEVKLYGYCKDCQNRPDKMKK
ncbi:MAG: hypothetical protein K0R92_838 [Lachnospiraceae bacterium]|nr:hypothetical protein [Lachnospiraceae bacterium]